VKLYVYSYFALSIPVHRKLPKCWDHGQSPNAEIKCGDFRLEGFTHRASRPFSLATCDYALIGPAKSGAENIISGTTESTPGSRTMSATVVQSPLGLLRAVSAGVDPVGFFRRRANHADPFVLMFPGLGRVTFFNTAKGARDILTARSDVCQAPTPNPIEPIVGRGSLILLSGDQHRRERELLTPAFHGDRIKDYADIIARVTADEIAGVQPGNQIAVRELSVAIALQVAIRVVFSVTGSARRAEYADAIKALMRANIAPLMLLPALQTDIRGRGPWAKLLRLRDQLDELLREDMADRRRKASATADMLDILLSATDEHGHGHSEQELHDQLRTLLAAGHETTATSLTWALYHIYSDHSVLDRLVAELSDRPTPRGMVALPYLGAVIKESLRMHPPVPIVLRRLTAGLTVDGVHCKAGDVVGIALYALHFNPDIWPEPQSFDPERFLAKRWSPFEYAPFGGGHRRCIGAAFANSELAVALGTIIGTLDLRMPERDRTRSEPRSVARGIAVTPTREVTLDVIDRR
jgi:cytochrome P450